MEKYKGFLLEDYSGRTEERAWDGHRMDGTGVYTSYHGVKIIDIETPEPYVVAYCGNTKEAKEEIDKYFTVDSRSGLVDLRAQRDKMVLAMTDLEGKIETLKNKYWEMKRSLQDLEGELHLYERLRREP